MFYTNDPVADFDRWDAEQEKKLERLPHCSECDNPIYPDEYVFEFNDELICEKCLNDNHRKWAEDYVR